LWFSLVVLSLSKNKFTKIKKGTLRDPRKF
jgi:hypothetical protein